MTGIDVGVVEQVQAVLLAPRPWSITQAGDPVLRQRAQRYDGQLPEELLHELLDAMRQHLPGVGVGIAAPQIGISLAIAVIEDPADLSPEIAAARERPPQGLLELVNPIIAPLGLQRRSFYEGCLSVSGLAAVVSRHRDVELSAQDRNGRECTLELSGWPARIAQHETDHLNGMLYVDRCELRSLSTVENYQQRWTDPTPAAAAEVLGFPL